MAFITTTPTILSQVNWYEFENAHVLTREQTIVLDCRRGYRDPNTGEVVRGDIVTCTVSDADYAAALGSPIAAGMTLGEAVVAAAYALLIAAGTIPAEATEL